jgi:hypothetical protein
MMTPAVSMIVALTIVTHNSSNPSKRRAMLNSLALNMRSMTSMIIKLILLKTQEMQESSRNPIWPLSKWLRMPCKAMIRVKMILINFSTQSPSNRRISLREKKSTILRKPYKTIKERCQRRILRWREYSRDLKTQILKVSLPKEMSCRAKERSETLLESQSFSKNTSLWKLTKLCYHRVFTWN